MKRIHVTEPMRQIALESFKLKGFTQQGLGDKLGVGRAWVNKFFHGSLGSITEERLREIEDALDVSFFSMPKTSHQPHSELASRMAALVDHDPDFARLSAVLLTVVAQSRGAFVPRFVPTSERATLGKKIVILSLENRAKPGKVAREVLRLLSKSDKTK